MDYQLSNHESITIRHQDLPNIILPILYEARESSTGFISLGEIIRMIGVEKTASELYETAGYLETKGYVKADYVLGGVFVRLTTPGIVYVEDNLKNNNSEMARVASDIYERFRPNLTNFTETEEYLIELRKPLHKTLDEIKQILNNKIGSETPLLLDAQIMKLELQKPDPDPEILSAKITALNHARLGPVMTKLKDQIGLDLSSRVIDGGIF